MSCCCKASLTLIGSDSVSLSPIGGEIGLSTTLVGVGNFVASEADKYTFSMESVCRANVRIPYLDINPKVVWLLACEADNDVLSNTKWKVD